MPSNRMKMTSKPMPMKSLFLLSTLGNICQLIFQPRMAINQFVISRFARCLCTQQYQMNGGSFRLFCEKSVLMDFFLARNISFQRFLAFLVTLVCEFSIFIHFRISGAFIVFSHPDARIAGTVSINFSTSCHRDAMLLISHFKTLQ